ncbi:hypothetical protein Efla_002868 [Eimeria flavescens]
MALYGRFCDYPRAGVTSQNRRLCHPHENRAQAVGGGIFRELRTRQRMPPENSNIAGTQAPKGILHAGFHSRVHVKKLHEDDSLQQTASHATPPWWRYPQALSRPSAPDKRNETGTLALSELSQVGTRAEDFPIMTLSHRVSFRIASGETLEVRAAAENVAFVVGESWQCKASATFLITNTPYRVMVGAAWLREEMAMWDPRKKIVTVGAGERENTFNLEAWQTAPDKGP